MAVETPLHTSFFKHISRWLFVVLFLMIACFFTWSENIIITRAIKVVGRMGVLLGTVYIYYTIAKKVTFPTLQYKNVLVLFFYILYLVLGFMSFAWSTNPFYSALQWFMIVQSLAFAYFFIKSIKLLDYFFENHPIRWYRLLGNAIFGIQMIFIVGMWLNPDTFFRYTNGGKEARLGGIIMNPNELGMLAGVGIAALIFDGFTTKMKKGIVIKVALLFYALILTGSRSSLIGVILIIVFFIFQTKNKKLKFSILTIALLVVPFAFYFVILKGGDPERLNEIMNLTGRLPFWKALLTEGLPREPWLGFGFMRIDYNEFFQNVHTYPGKMTHNTFIQVLMNLGLIGLFIVIVQFIVSLRSFLIEKQQFRLILISIFIPLLINSFTEFGIYGESNYGILFFQMLLFLVSFSPQKA